MNDLSIVLIVLVPTLWQLTLPLAALWALTLPLRKYSMVARYSPLLSAALKFLVPCTVLATIAALGPRHPSDESGMNGPLLAMLVNHLWQSTLFAAAILALALLLRRNSARIRYSLWLAASLKFLVPFAALAALGTLIPWHAQTSEPGAGAPRVLAVAGDIVAPMASDITFPTGTRRRDNSRSYSVVPVRSGEISQLSAALLVWFIGVIFIVGRWLVRWFRIQLTLRRSVVVANLAFPAPVRATPQQLEPGVVGIFRPRLLLPAGIEERLTGEQMRAVLAHERCHLHWRDNLTASLHMVVEAVFWFFPPVWWIGARLIDERERACDEQVVRDGHAPESYAESILNVCEHYVASRLPCVSGISGSDLRKRIASILKNALSLTLDRPRKFALVAMACCTVATPIVAGVVSVNKWQALLSLNASTAAALDYAMVRNAAAELAESALRNPDPLARSCIAPGAEMLRKQKALATTANRLGPHDDRALLYAVMANSPGDVQRLMAAGASWPASALPGDPHYRGDDFTRYGKTPIHVAAIFGDERMLDTLAKAGADIDKQFYDGRGGTPLTEAIGWGQADNAEWFIRHGANINTTSMTGFTVLATAMLSCLGQDMVARLINAGALPNDVSLRIANKGGFDLRGDQPWQAPSRDHAEVTADLDGDGNPDHARLLASADRKREGLFVQLSSQKPQRWIHASEANALNNPVPPMQITATMPGKYDKRCDASLARYGIPCKREQSPVLTLMRPGIRFAPKGGAASIVYWNDKDHRFERALIKD